MPAVASGVASRQVVQTAANLPYVAYRRRCSRPSCTRHAAATLTYIYSESTAVLGPLSDVVEPHGYDMCAVHAERLTAPLGWELIRIAPDPMEPMARSEDMEALANAVREHAVPASATESRRTTLIEEPIQTTLAGAVGEGVQRGHLRSLPGQLPGMDV